MLLRLHTIPCMLEGLKATLPGAPVRASAPGWCSGGSGSIPGAGASMGLEHPWGWSILGAGASLGLEHPWGWSILGAGASLGLEHPWGWSILGAGASLGLQHPWGWSILGAGASLGLEYPWGWSIPGGGSSHPGAPAPSQQQPAQNWALLLGCRCDSAVVNLCLPLAGRRWLLSALGFPIYFFFSVIFCHPAWLWLRADELPAAGRDGPGQVATCSPGMASAHGTHKPQMK